MNWDSETYYDLYSDEGHFLQSFSIPDDLGKITYIDSKGYVYTRGSPDDFPAVHKYNILFVEK